MPDLTSNGMGRPFLLLRQRLTRHPDVLLFAASNVGMQITMLLCQIVVLRLIPPEKMGIWQAALVLEVYLLVTRLGIVNALNREYPYAMGLGNANRARMFAATAQGYVLGNGLFLSGLFVLLGLTFSVWAHWVPGWDSEGIAASATLWRISLLVIALIVPLEHYNQYLQGTYRSSNKFRSLALIQLAQIPVHGVSVLLPWLLGFPGFAGRALLISVAFTACNHVFRPVRVRPAFRRKVFRMLFSTGWRLFLWNYLFNMAKSFPRQAMMVLGGSAALGLFTPVASISLVLNGIAGSLSSYLYPRLTMRYARDQVPVGRLAMKAGLLVVAGLAPMVLVGVLIMPWVFPVVLPKYAKAMTAGQVALVAGLFECLSIGTLTFAVTKAWRAMTVYLVAALAVRGAAAFGGFHLVPSDRLLGVAIGMLAAAMVMGVVTWLTVRNAKVVGKPIQQTGEVE